MSKDWLKWERILQDVERHIEESEVRIGSG